MPFSEWMGDSWMSPPVMLAFMLIGSPMAAAPLIRIVTAVYVERILDTRVAFGLAFLHIAIILALWKHAMPGLLLLYLTLVVASGFVAPLIHNVSEWLAVKSLADEDIHRYQYMLKANPYDALTRVALANAYVERRRLDEAVTEYDLAVNVDPHYAEHASFKLRRLIESRVRAKGKKKYVSDLHGEFQVPNDKINFTVEKDDMDIDLRD